MKLNEFYREYSNLPIGDRFKLLDIKTMSTMQDLYRQIDELNNKMRPDNIRLEKLLKEAEEGIYNLTHIHD